MDYLFGPLVEQDGTVFRLYAPGIKAASVLVEDRRATRLKRAENGFWSGHVPGVGEGARYKFKTGELDFPDLGSRQQASTRTRYVPGTK